MIHPMMMMMRSRLPGSRTPRVIWSEMLMRTSGCLFYSDCNLLIRYRSLAPCGSKRTRMSLILVVSIWQVKLAMSGIIRMYLGQNIAMESLQTSWTSNQLGIRLCVPNPQKSPDVSTKDLSSPIGFSWFPGLKSLLLFKSFTWGKRHW